MIQIRRVFTHLEEIRHEFGPVADVPLLLPTENPAPCREPKLFRKRCL